MARFIFARFTHGRMNWEINLHLRATTASLNERQNAEITLTHCERAGRTFELPTHPSIHLQGGKNCCTFCQTNELQQYPRSSEPCLRKQMNHCDMDGFGMKITGLIVASITDLPRPTCSTRRTYPYILSYPSLCVLCQSDRPSRDDETRR